MGMVKEFVWLVCKRWWALMSCAVFTLLGLYLTKYPQTPDWVYWINGILAGFFLFLAAFMVWRQERILLNDEQAKNITPNLKATISDFVRDAGHNSNAGFNFFANISVVNLSDAATTVRSVYIKNEQTRCPASKYGRAQLLRHKVISVPFHLEEP
jgi:hypothetical protein